MSSAALFTERPKAPQQVQDTGLSALLLAELLLKAMQQHGLTHLRQLTDHLKLGPLVLEQVLGTLRREQLVELRHRGEFFNDVSYRLTQAGHSRAADALARSPYCGPAPVPLDTYTARVHAQSGGALQQPAQPLLRDLVLGHALREQLGVALNSRRATLLFGPSGSGKTYLCRRLAEQLAGTVAVPYAVEAGGEIVSLFDPLVHRPLPRESAGQDRSAGNHCPDARWVACERPLVVTGSELTPSMLELSYDAQAGCYHAPPQLKANNGMLLVDDLGRQGVPARQLLHRCLGLVDQRQEQLTLRNGTRFKVPFEARLFFATHLQPDEVADEGFLRRIGQCIHVGALAPDDYHRVVHQACDEAGVDRDETVVDLLQTLHRQDGRPLLAGYPQALATAVAERAAYHGVHARMDAEMLRRVWQQRFAHQRM